MPGPQPTPPWQEWVDLQDGIVSRGQLLALGLSSAAARTNVDSARWRTLHPGVYATFTGPVGPRPAVWAAVLYAGAGAAAGHRTALWLAGAVDDLADPIDVCVPASRRVFRQPGLRIHLSRAMDDIAVSALHPSASPPRIRPEVALLDVCDRETSSSTVHLVLQMIQRRVTTADRVRNALNARPRHRWRALIQQMLAEAENGVASPLELAYRRRVERGHRLPLGLRNLQEVTLGGGRWYRDVRYVRWSVVVELDGREAHPADRSFRDYRRDNIGAVAGETVLRYGWRDVVGNTCAVAAQVAQVLALRGWRAGPAPCGPACPAPTTFQSPGTV